MAFNNESLQLFKLSMYSEPIKQLTSHKARRGGKAVKEMKLDSIWMMDTRVKENARQCEYEREKKNTNKCIKPY